MRPQLWHIRRCTQRPPIARQSSQPAIGSGSSKHLHFVDVVARGHGFLSFLNPALDGIAVVASRHSCIAVVRSLTCLPRGAFVAPVGSARMGAVIRQMAAGLALFLAGWSLAGCGGGGHPSPGASTRTSASGVGAPAKPITRLHAVAIARAVNLRPVDVPGFTVSDKKTHEHETAAEKRLEHEMLRCVGVLGTGKALAEVSSRDFKLERGIVMFSVHSEVSVAPTPALAAKNLSTLRGKRIRTCLSHYLTRFFRDSAPAGSTVSPVSIASGTPPAPGASGSFGWRISATFTVHRIPIPFYFDILSFVYGHAVVSLFSSGLPEPFPAKAQEKLFTLLVARAGEHST